MSDSATDIVRNNHIVGALTGRGGGRTFLHLTLNNRAISLIIAFVLHVLFVLGQRQRSLRCLGNNIQRRSHVIPENIIERWGGTRSAMKRRMEEPAYLSIKSSVRPFQGTLGQESALGRNGTQRAHQGSCPRCWYVRVSLRKSRRGERMPRVHR
jgi:hypothetical protein